MKSKTSSSNMTILKKDIVRFAPAWVLYIVASLLVLLLIVQFEAGYYLADTVAASTVPMAFCAFCYAFLCAQLLFGDLFNARLCNALHAMPMRRGRWFGTHVTAGILFAFVPHLIFAVCSAMFMGELWTVSFMWMLAADLQYLFFFGLAVFSMLCVGNRFAAAMVYGLINFMALLFAWFADSLFVPMLYGIEVNVDAFSLFCPLTEMMNQYDLISVSREREDGAPWLYKITFGDGWAYLAICAVLGVGLLLLALHLYRKRKLESAGDFIAVRALEPIFLVLYALTVGAMLQLISGITSGDIDFVFLAIGLAIGYFTGQMLIQRTIRVFSKRSFLGFAVLAAVLGGSLLLTWLDPIGITRWVPEAEDVESVTLQFRSSYYGTVTLEDADEIEDMLQVHARAIAAPLDTENDYVATYRDENGVRHSIVHIVLRYELKNGTSVQRHYPVMVETKEGELLRTYFSSKEFVLGFDFDTAEEYLAKFDFIEVENHALLDHQQKIALVEAIMADCEAGNMVQVGEFHEDGSTVFWAWFQYDEDVRLTSNEYRYRDLRIYDCCENLVAWYKENINEDYGSTEPYNGQDPIPEASGS